MLKDLLNFKKNEYIYLSITPIICTRSYNSGNLISLINKIMTTSSRYERYRKDNGELGGIQINPYMRVEYIIDIKKENTLFLFKIPSTIEKEFTIKLREVFKDSLISRIDYEEHSLPYAKWLGYDKADPLSIHTDARQQELVNNIIENIDIFEDNDNAKIKISFSSLNRVAKMQFQSYINDVDKKIKNGENLKTNDGIIKGLSGALLNTGVSIIDGLFGAASKTKETPSVVDMVFLMTNQEKFKMSKSTLKKKNADVMRTSIEISSSNKKIINNICNSFTILNEDNCLTPRRSYIDNIMSIQECGQLVQVCGNEELMDRYNIPHLKFKELSVPQEVQKGTLSIGSYSYRNKEKKIYISDDNQNKFLATVLCGPSRSGKTTLLQNLFKNALDTGSSVVFFDFIETCRASNEILNYFPKDKLTIINLAEKVEGLDFNEINMDAFSIPEKKYEFLKKKANAVIALVDSCNLSNDEDLKSQMRKILMSIILIASSQNKTLKIAIQALQDFYLRKELIDNIPDDLKIYLQDSVNNLRILDERDRRGNFTGNTKISSINSILNRLYSLQMNFALEKMINTSPENNVNLIDEMQKGKFIIIQIPDEVASTNQEKDIICSYYFNKIWLALQQRAATMDDSLKKRLIIAIDEVYQLRNTELLLKERVNQIAKYCAKFLVTCHSIDQIKGLKKELISSDASYIIIAGSDESCLKDLKERFYNYNVEDLKKLKVYHALCSLKTNSHGYINCIAALPPKLKS